MSWKVQMRRRLGALYNPTEDEVYPEEVGEMPEEHVVDIPPTEEEELEAKQKEFAKMDTFKRWSLRET